MVAFITELKDENYDHFVETGLVLVDVFAVWCGPCKQISPIVDKLSVDFQGQLTVGKLDADQSRDTVEKLGVRSIPTLFLYKDGKVVERLTGMQTYQKLSDLIQKYSN
jgi:thioredoxin 1